jgi:hypothetical protein
MTAARIVACSLALAGALVFASNVPAADDTPAKPPAAHAKGKTVKPATKSTDASEAERAKREDLERRVEKLEQENEMKQPAMPPTDAAPR